MRRTYLKIYVVFFLLGIFTLSGCSAIGGGSPTPLPTVILGDLNLTPEGTGVGLEPVSGGTSASGVIAPKEDAQLVFTLAGKIAAMDVAVGQRVEARQTLAQLEGQEELQAAISAAEYKVEQARQALSDLQEESEGKRVQAMQDVITYERAVRDAQYALDNFTVPSNQANLDTVEAISIMKERMDEARARFEPFKYRPSTDPIREDRLEALNEAQADYNAAVKRLQYEYNLDVAETQLTQAQSDYATFKAGPDPDQNRLAEARLSDAETQLSAAQAASEGPEPHRAVCRDNQQD